MHGLTWPTKRGHVTHAGVLNNSKIEKINMYKDNFKSLVSKSVETNTFIGDGNPDSQILLIGKEGSNEGEDDNTTNSKLWETRCKENIKPDFSYFFDGAYSKPGHTWKKYQKLHGYIFPEQMPEYRKFNFHERVFTTEMNVKPSKNTGKAIKDDGFAERIRTRKFEFLTTDFIQDFRVIILACSDYIINVGEGEEREIDTIFGVSWDKPHIIEQNNKKYRFDTHYDKNKTKLVIHCRQLSGSIPEKYFQDLGEVVREFIQSPKTES